MYIARLYNHLLIGQLAVHRCFSQSALANIELAIQQSENQHSGEICFAVEAALNTIPLFKGQTARERALEVFSQLRIWDTEKNNGILIYLLLADRDVEIIADRGFNDKVTYQDWELICRQMESAFQQQQFEVGAIDGIHAVSELLQKHYPENISNKHNQISNQPVILD